MHLGGWFGGEKERFLEFTPKLPESQAVGKKSRCVPGGGGIVERKWNSGAWISDAPNFSIECKSCLTGIGKGYGAHKSSVITQHAAEMLASISIITNSGVNFEIRMTN